MDIRFSKYPAHYTVFILFFIALINGFYLDDVYQSNIITAWVYDTSQFVILPFTLLFILYKYYGIRPSDYGIIIPTNNFNRNTLIQKAILYAALLEILYFVTYKFTDMYIPDKHYMGYLSLIPTGILKLPVVFYMSITAAVVEEIVYRGIPFMLFKKHKEYKHFNSLFIIITASLFSLVHWENGIPDLAATFVFGIFAAMLYLNYNNLIPLIFAHFVGDFVTFW